MCRKLISDKNQGYKFHSPLSREWLDTSFADLGVTVNDSLKSFLLETDGLYDYRRFLWVVWNVRDLVAYNQEMRNNLEFADKGYRFDDLFYIANYGADGILFGFRIVNNNMQEDVIAWYPETNKRITVTDTLKDHLDRWINKKDLL